MGYNRQLLLWVNFTVKYVIHHAIILVNAIIV